MPLVQGDDKLLKDGRPTGHGVGSRASRLRGCICRWCDPERWGPDFADGSHWEYFLSIDSETGARTAGSWVWRWYGSIYHRFPSRDAAVQWARRKGYGKLIDDGLLEPTWDPKSVGSPAERLDSD